MSGVIDSLEREQLRKVPAFDAGDRVKVHFQVVEGTRRRTQVFEGVVLKRQGSGARETFTVRKQSFGVGVERTFPLHSPKIERIEIASCGDVRRAKLYYLRGRVGHRARVRERRFGGVEIEEASEPVMADAQGAQEAPVEEEATAESPAGQDDVVAEGDSGEAAEGEPGASEGEAEGSDEPDSAGDGASPDDDQEQGAEEEAATDR